MAKQSRWARYFGRTGVTPLGHPFKVQGNSHGRARILYTEYNSTVDVPWPEVVEWLKDKLNPLEPYIEMVEQLIAKGMFETEAVYTVDHDNGLHGQLWFNYHDVQRVGGTKQDWVTYIRTHPPIPFCKQEMCAPCWKYLLCVCRKIFTEPNLSLEECIYSIITRYTENHEKHLGFVETKEALRFMAERRMEYYGV